MLRQFGVIGLVSLLLNIPSTFASDTTNDLPSFQATRAEEQAEYQLGRQFLRQLRASTPLLEDPLLINYLESLSYRLSFNSSLISPDLQLILIPDRRINAFAVPGGVIGVNQGLLLYADNEAELAAVLAHELGHISQHHYQRSQEANSSNTLLYLGALLTSIALSTVDSDAGLALGMSTQAALVQKELSYSRQHEREADRVGMQTLVAAGFNPDAVPNFFTKMDKQARLVGLIPDFLLTHPMSQERIADSTSRARAYNHQGAYDSVDYQLIRARLLAIMNQNDSQQIAAFRQQLQDNPNNAVARLSLALALMNKDQFAQARSEIAVLLTQSPNKIDYVIASADIDIADNHPEKALKTLEQALLISPDSVVLGLYAARAATLNQQAQRSLTWLEPLSRQRPEDPIVWRAMMEAYQQQKDALGVLRTRAELKFLLGQGDKALKDLEQAAELAKKNYPLAAKIAQRRSDMQATVALEKK